MGLVRLKYKGGRTFSKQYWNRQPYIFKKETDFICDVPQELANFLAQAVPGQYFSVPAEEILKKVIVEKETDKLVCEVCGFKAKSEFGLTVHSRKHGGIK